MGPRLNRVRRGIVKRGVLAVAAVRLVPVAPFTLVNLVAGASRIRFSDYLLGTIIGMAPGLILMSRTGRSDLEHHHEADAHEHPAVRSGGARLARSVDWRTGLASALAETPQLRGRAGIVRVMTWNIHGGIGPDRRFDLGRIVATIAQHHPDVVALQEVDSRRTVAAGGSPFALLREAVGDHGIEAKSITTADGEYGQMVVSRWPFNSTRDSRHHPRQTRAAARHRGRDFSAGRHVPAGCRALRPEPFRATATSTPTGGNRSPAQHDDSDARRFQRMVLAGFAAWSARARAACPYALRDIPFLVSAPAPGPDFLLAARSDAGELRRPRRPSCIRPPPGGG